MPLRYIEFQAPNRAVMARAAVPAPAPAEALVETVQSGISLGTERMWLDGSAGALRSGRRSYPYRPGYALVGRVVAAGRDFAGAPVGARLFAMKPHGSHAVLEASDRWLALPDSLGDDDALAIALTATALHAVDRSAPAAGDGAIVAGLGTLGLILLQVLVATRTGPVVALTGTADKAALALTLGATAALTYDELPDRRANLPPIRTVFECSGVAANVARVLPLTRERGEILLAGFYNEPIALDGEVVFANELTITGTRATGSGAERGRNLARAGALVIAGKVRTHDLTAHRFRAEDFADAYCLVADRARSRGAIRVCLAWQ